MTRISRFNKYRQRVNPSLPEYTNIDGDVHNVEVSQVILGCFAEGAWEFGISLNR